MNITQYIEQHQLRRVEDSHVKPLAMPSEIARKFDLSDSLEHYASANGSRWVSICRTRDLFAATKSGVAVLTGTLNKDYDTLRSL